MNPQHGPMEHSSSTVPWNILPTWSHGTFFQLRSQAKSPEPTSPPSTLYQVQQSLLYVQQPPNSRCHPSHSCKSYTLHAPGCACRARHDARHRLPVVTNWIAVACATNAPGATDASVGRCTDGAQRRGGVLGVQNVQQDPPPLRAGAGQAQREREGEGEGEGEHVLRINGVSEKDF
jgi:hypothetical protein